MSLQTRINTDIVKNLTKSLGEANRMALPHIKMVKVQVGIGSMTKNTKDFSGVVENLAKITGQKPVVMKAKKAVSNFKLREGMPVAVLVTLRGKRAIDFIDRLVNIALPRVRDFRGLSLSSFDGNGNYSIGLKEALVFPEINPDDVQHIHGLQVTVVTSAGNDDEGKALLTEIGFPFKKEVETVNS